jgi:hypothetical protein
MPESVTIRLYDTETTATDGMSLVVGGTRAGPSTDVVVDSVILTSLGAAVTYTAIGTAGSTIPAAFIDQTKGKDDLRLQAGTLPTAVVVVLASNATGASPVPFLDRQFQPGGGVDLRLVLNLPGAMPEASPPPLAVFSGRGNVNLTKGAATFGAVAVGFRVVIDRPATIPSSPLAVIELELPGDIPWPPIRIPWPEFPRLPVWPIRLPALSVPLGDLPLTVGFKAIEVSTEATNSLRVHVDQLQLKGVGDFGGSFDLVFDGTNVKVEPSFPALSTITNPVYKDLAEGCFEFDWTGSPANALVGLLTSEFADALSGPAAINDSFGLRVHAPGRKMEEVRLDWSANFANRSFNLPGFAVGFDGPKMLSVIAKRPSSAPGDTGVSRLTLAATFDTGKGMTARSTFSWPLGDSDREMLRDGTGADSNSLITFKATAAKPVSLVLFDLPLGPDGPPRFLRQLDAPLSALGALSGAGADPCPASPVNVVDLVGGDWNFEFQFPGTFTLPFLNLGGQSLTIKLPQSPKPSVDPNTGKVSCTLEIDVKIAVDPTAGNNLELTTNAVVSFDPSRMAFDIDHDQGLWLTLPGPIPAGGTAAPTFLGLDWSFQTNPNASMLPDGTKVPANAIFNLATKNGNYQVRQAPGSTIKVSYGRATKPDEPIVFKLTDFALTPKGIDFRAEVTDQPARFNGLETQFKFTSGVLQVHESRIAGFTITGSGPLPPALVGDAVADVALQFAQRGDGGPVRLVRGSAKIKGSNLLHCQASRFSFSLDGLGLDFVDDAGADHLYFTLSGRASYNPIQGTDDPSGPLAWLPKIEIQLVDCPLTGNMQVIAKHVKFLIPLPKKPKFSLLGCFEMEIRAIGFVPQFPKLGAGKDSGPDDPTSAMQLSGQIMFAEGGGDVIETKVDFHDLFVALPPRGEFFPRLYCKGLAITIKQGDAFELSGEVEFFNNEPVDKNPDGSPILGDGFAGKGTILIQGLPRMTATFAFLRVSADGGTSWKRAWFLYLEATEMSIQIPVVEIFIREIGLGFGYRYTLASIKTADQINDPKKLLKELKRLALTQGNLSSRDQWRVDLEDPGQDARWTVVLRAMISQTSAQAGPFGDYDESKLVELPLSCLFILDVVLALRSDLTFFMAGRAWMNTNYVDFHTNQGYDALGQPSSDDQNLRDRPLLAAFVLLSPRQKRFLANLSSNGNAAFGNHPPLPDFLKTAIRDSKYSATLLVEPNLFHMEVGWPDQLQWTAKLGPLQAEFRGGTIFRVSTTELVVGNSFLARGTLDLKAGFDAGFIGASLTAFAQVAYGARYIGVLNFKDIGLSAFYGAIGVEIRVSVSIEFWIKIPAIIKTIKLSFSFSIGISFTAALEVGITLKPEAGARGTATIGIELMGHSVQFDVRVGIFDSAVDDALDRTNPFLHIGLESDDAGPEAIPGTGPQPAAIAHQIRLARQFVRTPLLTHAEAAARPSGRAAAVTDGIKPPDGYKLVSLGADNYRGIGPDLGKARRYVVVIPKAPDPGNPLRFYPPPPDPTAAPVVVHDLEWNIPAAPTVAVEHFDPKAAAFGVVPTGAAVPWSINWTGPLDFTKGDTSDGGQLTLGEFLTHAYLIDATVDPIRPVADPEAPPVFGMTVSDDRVQNPSDAAYDAAVRGAFAEVAAPFLKFDESSVYDSTLKDAFRRDTTIYKDGGVDPDPGRTQDPNYNPNTDPLADNRRAIQLRGSVIHSVLRDVQEYASLDGLDDDASKARMSELEKVSLAFRLGLVFRATGLGDSVHWLEGGGGTIDQRATPASTTLDAVGILVDQFNPRAQGFALSPPAFLNVRKYEHANMVGLAWDLRRGSADQPEDPEHHLSHYQVRRLHLNGKDPEAVFTIKKGTVLHRTSTDGVLLPPRFQMTDRFEDEAGSDVSALTNEGKLYLYTVTPIDLSGVASPRPLSIVATRLPADPPLVPGDGELVLTYPLRDAEAAWPVPDTKRPSVRQDGLTITFEWSDPPPAAGTTPPAVETYRLIFRREAALPIGFFGADADTRGGRTAGFPVTNARTLRTDRVIEIRRDDPINRPRTTVPDPETGLPMRADSGRFIQQVTIGLQEMIDAGVFPPGGAWRPDAWRVFVQAVSPLRGSHGTQVEGVPSALAAVAVRLRFLTAPEPAPSGQAAAAPVPALAETPATFSITPFEERKVGLLEWLPDPVRFNLLPPEDQTSRDGFALVPMPILSATNNPSAGWRYPLDTPVTDALPGLRFEAHPERFRAIQMTWNQGPSGQFDHPIELHAKYQLFEFDADANTGESLEFPAGTLKDVSAWATSAGLRVAQEVELLPADDLALNPSETTNPVSWDVWTPATSRRILLRRKMIRERTWPERTDPTRLGPWYSWRDSYLVWPAEDVPSVPSGAPQPPPIFDDTTQRLWPFHVLFRALLADLLSIPEAPAAAGQPRPLPRYTVEPGRGPTRATSSGTTGKDAPGGGKRVNDFPNPDVPADPKAVPPSPLSAFLAGEPPATDPHGWGVLDRMGLGLTFRVRVRKTGEYVIGLDLVELVRRRLSGLRATRVGLVSTDPDVHPIALGEAITLTITPSADGVSFLAPASSPDGAFTAVPNGAPATITTVTTTGSSPLLLVVGDAVVQMSPAPNRTTASAPPLFGDLLTFLHVEHLFQPGARTVIGPRDDSFVDGVPAAGLLALARLSLRPKVRQRMFYQAITVTGVDPGTPCLVTLTPLAADASFLVKTGTPGIPTPLPTALTIQPIMPKEGRLVVLLRGKAGPASVATVTATKPDKTPIAASVPPTTFQPTEWQAAYFTVPPEAPWAKVATDDEAIQWAQFSRYLAKVRADLTLPDPGTPAGSNDLASLLSWLDRFFEEGGGIEPSTTADAVSTADGPWVVSAYPRAATPIALTPDAAGRITYFHPIEDLWGHTYRYLLRPQGRYDRLWAALGQSGRVFPKTIGHIGRVQSLIAPPEPGGMDIVLERIRPLAAPLVLSSGRLDPLAPPGTAVAPGGVWEVVVAKHPEQALVEKNRALVNHLGFRQVSHTLARSFADPAAVANLAATLGSVVSQVYPSRAPSLPRSFQLVAGATTFPPITLAADATLADLATLIPSAAATAKVSPAGKGVQLILTPASPTFPLRLLAVDGSVEISFLSEPLDLQSQRFSLPVNSVPAPVDPTALPPPLPSAPTSPVTLDFGQNDDVLSIDLPLRSKEFGQGIVAIQWRSIPYYYQYKLMLIAQSSAVVSPITTLVQRDFQYISPAPEATMEGVPSGDGLTRSRKITIRLGRYWDCLPADAQARWAVEDPASVGPGNPDDKTTWVRRLSSLPDPAVVYQIVVTRQSRNVEVVAEYRSNPAQPSGYDSRTLPGPFVGVAVRAIPPADGPGVGREFIFLETLLIRSVDPAVDQVPNVAAISGKAAFAGAAAAGVAVTFPTDPAFPAERMIAACAVRLEVDTAPTPAVVAALSDLANASDTSFAAALRQLLTQSGPSRYAEACVGLEQLAEVHPGITIDATSRAVVWKGPLVKAESDIITGWAKTSLFQATFNKILTFQFTFAYPVDPANPTQADTTLPPSRLAISTSGLAWSNPLTVAPTAAELAALNALKTKAGLPTKVVDAITALIAAVTDFATVTATIPIVEADWKPRPTQATLPPALQGALLVGHGVMAFQGMMTIAEGNTLQKLAGLTAPDLAAVARLFEDSLNGGLGGGTLDVRARRGAADPVSSPIVGTLSQPAGSG